MSTYSPMIWLTKKLIVRLECCMHNKTSACPYLHSLKVATLKNQEESLCSHFAIHNYNL